MSWNSEEDFVNDFIANKKIIKSILSNPIVIKELKTGYGRPDFALIQFDKNIVCNSLRSRSCLSQLGTYAITFLSSRPWIRPDKLGNFLNINKKKQQVLIEELLQHDLIHQNNNLIKARPRSEIMSVKRVVTFEAKLQNWKEAIDQAERHLWFTNESYVLMPFMSEKLIVNISNECAKRGVGLCFYDPILGFKIKVKPIKKGVLNTPFIWSINDKLKEVKDDQKRLFSRY